MRFNRLNNKHFASEATNNGIFGSAQVGDGRGVTTSDYDSIPSLPAFDKGWNSAVITGKKLPPLEEMQGLQSYISYLVNYLYQEGFALWNSQQVYFTGSYCKIVQNGKAYIYVSLVDNNVNNDPLNTTGFWELSDASGCANTDLSNLSAEGQAKFDAKANVSLNNLDAAGQAKLKSNIQLVSAAPASPVAGVLYCIPE